MKLTYILLCYSSMFILGIIDNSRGPIYPTLLQYFEVSKAQGSLIFSLSSLIAFFTTLTNKSWISRFGAIKPLRLSLFLHTISCLLMGTSPSGDSGFYQFLIGGGLFGMAIGIQGISLNMILSRSTDDSDRRRVFAGLHSMYGIASLVGPFILSWLFEWNIRWQSYFLFLAILPFTVFIFSFRFKPQNFKPADISSKISFDERLTFGAIFSLYVASEVLISSRLVMFLNMARGWEQSEAAGQLSLFFICLLGGRVLFAVKEFKTDSLILLKTSIISTLLVLFIGLYLYEGVLFLSGLTMSYFFPAGMDYILRIFKERGDAIISHVMISIGGVIVLMHLSFGALADLIGLRNTWLLAPIMLLSVLYLVSFKVRTLANSE